VLATA